MESKAKASSVNGLVRTMAKNVLRICSHSSLLVPLREQLSSGLEELYVLGPTADSGPTSASDIAVVPFSPDEYAKQDAFHSCWKRFMRGLLEQWQVVNYVSAVLVG